MLLNTVATHLRRYAPHACLMDYRAFWIASSGDDMMPSQVLEPLQMACTMDVPRIAEPALGCLHKLVSRPAQCEHDSQTQEPAAMHDNVPAGEILNTGA